MSNFTVSSGQTSTGEGLNPGDQGTVQSGGTAIDTFDDGQLDILAGGTGINTDVEVEGVENVAGVETVDNNLANLDAGVAGTQNILSGGRATGVEIQGGGIQNVKAGGSTFNIAVDNQGTQNVSGGASAD